MICNCRKEDDHDESGYSAQTSKKKWHDKAYVCTLVQLIWVFGSRTV